MPPKGSIMSHFKNAIDMGRGALCGCHKLENIIQIYNHTDKFAIDDQKFILCRQDSRFPFYYSKQQRLPKKRIIKFCAAVNKEKGIFSPHLLMWS